jgi:cytochrome oxidase Cu insertion factor (SCO1/SenC/PrrC family)
MSHRLLQIGTGALLGLAAAAVILFLAPGPPGAQEWVGASPPPSPYPAPPLELEDLDGNRVNLAEFRGWTTVVFFGYTHCPDVCPATLLNLSSAMEELGRRADRVRVVFVTVDPERDTPERLRSWLANFHPGIVPLRGSEERLREVASGWGVHMSVAASHEAHDEPAGRSDPGRRRAPAGDPDHGGRGDQGGEGAAQVPDGHAGHAPSGTVLPAEVEALVAPGAPGAYGVTHSSRSFVVDRSGRVVLFLAPFQGGEAMAADLRRVIR